MKFFRRFFLASSLIAFPLSAAMTEPSSPSAAMLATDAAKAPAPFKLESAQIFVPSAVSVKPGSVRKICQVLGNTDFETGQPAPNRTLTRYGLYGTDLGQSFNWGLKTFFLFGDTVGLLEEGARREADVNEDTIAYSTDTDPEDCLSLNFLAGTPRPSGFAAYLTPDVKRADGSKVANGAYEVPIAGFVVNNVMYVIFTTDVDWSGGLSYPRGVYASVLGKSTDSGKTFTAVYDLSRYVWNNAGDTGGKFINVSVATVNNADVPGLPDASGSGILLWGSAWNLESSVYLAYLPAAKVGDKTAIRYFKGMASGQPLWSAKEDDAVPVHGMQSPSDAHVREMSVTWNAYLKKWLMFYGGGLYRFAAKPWGAWSDENVLYDAWANEGYCHYLHGYRQEWCDGNDASCALSPCPYGDDESWLCDVKRCDSPGNDNYHPSFETAPALSPAESYYCDDTGHLWKSCDAAYDDLPVWYSWRTDWGAPYAPYPITRFTKGVAGKSTDIYFLLSTWNPYNVVLMKATLELKPVLKTIAR